ncbi:MAG: hypothetical protein PHR77_21320 [Kiritimatiellae bacterium]|nr:hypothetical protein [Kiritimatiellia bacterium]MDD5520727.1 hypothetical protein [Kiritimatiellia bacterium]
MKCFRLLVIAMALYSWTILSYSAQNKPSNRPPVIKHEPVTTAVRGQSISIRAVLTDDSDTLKSVTLFYTTSKDAAPFKITMQSAGAGLYFGSIPSSLIKGVSELSYYIEALDEQDVASETPWYTVKFQTPQPSASQPIPSQTPLVVQPPAQRPPSSTPTKQIEPKKESWSWKGPAIIAGGAAAVVGGAILAANASGSDGGGGGGGTSITNAGTYTGSATRYIEMPGSSPSASSYPITITVTSSGIVSTDTLHPDTHMEGQISGTEFHMTAELDETDITGQIVYTGTLLNTMITGYMAGTVTSSTGTNGTCSGTFSATK